jgi:hypothetical protein
MNLDRLRDSMTFWRTLSPPEKASRHLLLLSSMATNNVPLLCELSVIAVLLLLFH